MEAVFDRNIFLCEQCGVVFEEDNFLETEIFRKNRKKIAYLKCLNCGTCYKLKSKNGNPFWDFCWYITERTFQKYYRLTEKNRAKKITEGIIDDLFKDIDEILK